MGKKVWIIAFLSAVSVFAGDIKTLNEDNFQDKTSRGLVLVDFYAPWCGPCKRMEPVLKMIDDDMKDSLTIFKVDIDQSPSLAKKYKVSGVPTLVLMKNGKIKGNLVGFQDKSKIKKFIKNNQ